MRLKTAVIGPTTYKTFRKELLVLILGQPPSTTSLVLWYTYSHNNFSRILPESH
jgi:hypothetical protein